MIQALERPATTASATKSCSLIASVSPRICRAKRGHSRSAMTRTTFLKLGSETATSTTAIRMVGNDSPMSVRRMRTVSGNHGSESLGTGTPDPRIEEAVQHVHEEVARQVERAQHEHAGLHDRIVARGDRLEDQSSEARPGEHGLGDDGAAEELHEQHDGEGDDGQQRVLQSVLPEHHLLVQSLEPRALDVF